MTTIEQKQKRTAFNISSQDEQDIKTRTAVFQNFNSGEDSYWEDEDNFQCCDNCDLPDACSDYGCAIQQGLRRNDGF